MIEKIISGGQTGADQLPGLRSGRPPILYDGIAAAYTAGENIGKSHVRMVCDHLSEKCPVLEQNDGSPFW